MATYVKLDRFGRVHFTAFSLRPLIDEYNVLAFRSYSSFAFSIIMQLPMESVGSTIVHFISKVAPQLNQFQHLGVNRNLLRQLRLPHLVLSLQFPKLISIKCTMAAKTLRSHQSRRNMLSILGVLLVAVSIINIVFVIKTHNRNSTTAAYATSPFLSHLSSFSSDPSPSNTRPITSYWWPSVEDGGLLGKIYDMQNPSDCSSKSTKFFVWRSMVNNENDTRGLTAWAHTGASHLLHGTSSAIIVFISSHMFLS